MSILPLLLLTLAPAGAKVVVNATEKADVRSPMPPGWDEVDGLHPRYVVFGELHGTREAPAFVAQVVCALAARGKRVLLAVEHPATEDEALRKAWNLPERRFANALFRTAWTFSNDGRDSRAMFDMIVRLQRLKTRGAAISITSFNGMRDEAQEARWAHLPSQGPHEAAQAENIRIAEARGTYDLVIVLAGNFHASRLALDRGAGRLDTMANHLARSGLTISLNMRSSGGTAWNCSTKPDVHYEVGRPLPPDALECADFPYRDRPDLHRPRYIHIGALPGEKVTPDFDGFFWLGETSGSAPKKKQ
ncbi:hypothetical protein GCM10022253_06570 [Sphingomonas endophytica]|uniref:Nucleotide-binding universal stress UspA family protein n=1 Tax=Sphingomonas endophytica TaxID=869719 RepID=A0ABR6N0P5_9SPHN|nr:hypothetical protein [Sphingomonas endophytica]MBB5724348.1 nucleotide-binding universal stress UspA family protein [Sphingomonas endophytica]